MSRWLVIPDLQIPFQHKKALQFLLEVQQEYNIDSDNILCVGDEVDQMWGGAYKKDPMASHTARQEIEESTEILKNFIDLFPKLRICHSNHGSRWMRKAFDAEIPSIMMRQYQEVMGIPDTWRYADYWEVKCKYPFMIEHGDKHGGTFPHVQAAQRNGMSTVIGHYHGVLGVEYMRNALRTVWGLSVSSLIDIDSYAFKYTLSHSKKPMLGCGVILDDGKTAVPIPFQK